MMGESLKYGQWMDSIRQGKKIKIDLGYLKKRQFLTCNLCKEQGYILFDELATINQNVRDVMLEKTWKTGFLLFLSSLQSHR